MDNLWRRFRALPTWLQALLWFAVWPAVVGIVVAKKAPDSGAAKAAALAVLVIGGALWWSVPFRGDPASVEKSIAQEPAAPAPKPKKSTTRPRTTQQARPSRSPTPTPTPALAAPVGAPAGAQPAVVEKVVDGDTIWVRVEVPGGPLAPGATHKVRLLEYDSPESTTETECWGPESSEALAELTPVGATVWLAADREDTDQYGRFLRYVWTAGGTFVNATMVQNGFGEAALYPPNDAHIEAIRAAEADAKSASRGMWGPPCDYDAPPPPPPPPPPAPAAPPPPAAAPAAPADPPPADSGGSTYYANCSEARAAGAAPVYAGDPGYSRKLDRDGDGVGCE